MKKYLAIFFALAMIFTSLPATTAYAGDMEDTPIDKISDWAATIGKDGVERDRILAERKAERAKKRAAKKAEKMKKEAAKKGNEMKKKMGL